MSPPNREPQIITLSILLYRRLLHFGPNEFLQEYEEMMLLDFRQHCRDVHKRWGTLGILCSWRYLVRAVVDMSAERIAETSKKAKQAQSSRNKEQGNLILTTVTRIYRILTLTTARRALATFLASSIVAVGILIYYGTSVDLNLLLLIPTSSVLISLLASYRREKSTIGKESKIQ